MRRSTLPVLAALLLLAGCTLNLRQVQEPPRSLALATAYPWNSMVYLARTEAGVVVVDLGWHGAEGALRRGLRRMGATPDDVAAVFLTHSHRDHVAGWRAVRGARFHVAAAEVPLLESDSHHSDLPSRVAEEVIGNPAPWHGEVEVLGFGSDTAFVFGRDTVRAFPVPGHTPGSAAYLLRGVLFVGDAVAYSYLTGFRPAFGVFTDDPERGRASLAALWARVEPHRPRWVCTAHAKCAPADSAFVRKVTR
jgi:hydroxyacylglutathione hydrolase